MTNRAQPHLSRRALLVWLGSARWVAPLGAALGLPTGSVAATRPERRRPQKGDRLTRFEGEGRGAALRGTDLELGARPLLGVPLEPGSGLIRDGSRLNQILVVRLAPAALDRDTDALAADGIVAYSAVCTHTGCPVSEWNAAATRLVCPCHGSEFEAAGRGRVVEGPAPRRLAILPLELVAQELVVAGPFKGRVGFQMQ